MKGKTVLTHARGRAMRCCCSATFLSPVGRLTLAGADGQLTGLWMEGQKRFGGGITEEMAAADDEPVLEPVDMSHLGAFLPHSRCSSPVFLANSAYSLRKPGLISANATKKSPSKHSCPQTLEQTKDWLARYFAGGRPDAGELPLAPEGSEFQLEVWKILCAIPYGRTVTYGGIARMLAGKANRSGASARAVGGAVGRNPISIIIPCHRVVGADGGLTGYAGGLDRKRRLLELEGVIFGSKAKRQTDPSLGANTSPAAVRRD